MLTTKAILTQRGLMMAVGDIGRVEIWSDFLCRVNSTD